MFNLGNFKTLTGTAALATALLTGAPAIAQDDVGAILETFAADYMNDPTFTADVEFGVEVVGADWWTVNLDHEAGTYSVARGQPATPTFYYTADEGFIGRVERGEIAALTGMAKAFSTDVTPMDIDLMDGAGFDPVILSFTFHFWTRGNPEIINWREQETRFTHGGNAGIIYYQPGFRSGFGYIMPGQHINEDERSRTNPFPTLIVMTGGRAVARIDGEDSVFENGQMMLIPAGVSHEFLNPYDEPGEFLLFMFGEGA